MVIFYISYLTIIFHILQEHFSKKSNIFIAAIRAKETKMRENGYRVAFFREKSLAKKQCGI